MTARFTCGHLVPSDATLRDWPAELGPLTTGECPQCNHSTRAVVEPALPWEQAWEPEDALDELAPLDADPAFAAWLDAREGHADATVAA